VNTSQFIGPSRSRRRYDIKWDGYRIIAVKDGARVRLISRNAKDLTRDCLLVVAAIAQLKPADVVLDGEVVALELDRSWRSSPSWLVAVAPKPMDDDAAAEKTRL